MDGNVEKQLVFVGLGNPGKKYEMTRHNMGALIIQGFARMHSLAFKEENRFLARIAKGKSKGATVHLLLPTTYMNESGQSVRRYIDYFGLTPRDVVVATDDTALPLGELRLRSQGSSGGHNGLESVRQHLGTTHFARLRVGIGGSPAGGNDMRDYVLDNFSRREAEQLPSIVEQGVWALELLLSETMENAMNSVNARRKDEITKEKENNPKNTRAGDKQEEKL